VCVCFVMFRRLRPKEREKKSERGRKRGCEEGQLEKFQGKGGCVVIKSCGGSLLDTPLNDSITMKNLLPCLDLTSHKQDR
jgi:hypothetical protein